MSKQRQQSLLLALVILSAVLAVLTTLPSPASKTNLLGYRSLCAFVPFSTLILLGLAGFFSILRSALYGTMSRARREENACRSAFESEAVP